MSDTLHIFTCSAVNYLPKVRVLCQSIRKFHPEATVHWVLADTLPDWLDLTNEPFDSVLPIDRLDIPNWRGWSFTHDIVELSTAIKPFALRYLLDQPGCAKVLYFDPDMVLFSRVDDILDMLSHANVALTPHQTKPEQTLDAIRDNEMASMKHGIFNLGFIGVSNTEEGRRVAQWWSHRTYHFCRAEVENGLFTDQKWLDFAPAFFDGVSIVKSSRHNVATWNLTTRHLTGDAETGFKVDGEPLGFYHFTGFDSGAHRIMMEKNATASPATRDLVKWYEAITAVPKSDPISAWPWAFGRFSDGTLIQRCHRWLYREHADLQAAFPDPFAADVGHPTFLAWCHTEGKLHFPQFFSEAGDCNLRPAATSAAVIVGRTAFLRLAWLAMRPVRGRPIRSKIRQVLSGEGVRGLLRRLPF